MSESQSCAEDFPICRYVAEGKHGLLYNSKSRIASSMPDFTNDSNPNLTRQELEESSTCMMPSYKWVLEKRLLESSFFNPTNYEKAVLFNHKLEDDYNKWMRMGEEGTRSALGKAQRMQRAQNSRRMNPHGWPWNEFVPSQNMNVWTRIRLPDIPSRVNVPVEIVEPKPQRDFTNKYGLFGARGVQLLRRPLNPDAKGVANHLKINEPFSRRLAQYPVFGEMQNDSVRRNMEFYLKKYPLLMNAEFELPNDITPEIVLKIEGEDPRLTRLKYLRERKLAQDRKVESILPSIKDVGNSALLDPVFDPFTWQKIPEEFKKIIRTDFPSLTIPHIVIGVESSQSSVYEY